MRPVLRIGATQEVGTSVLGAQQPCRNCLGRGSAGGCESQPHGAQEEELGVLGRTGKSSPIIFGDPAAPQQSSGLAVSLGSHSCTPGWDRWDGEGLPT